MKWPLLFIALACPCTAFADAQPSRVTTTQMGGSFDAPIVDVFAPPTRSDNPYAATSTSVYVFKSELSAWDEVFRLPDAQTSILDVEGYENSSEPLYVAHSAGISITHDAGLQWELNTPRGYAPAADGWGGLTVHPDDRQRAVAATGRRAWRTSDFGAHWSALPLPQQSGKIAGVAFAREASGLLFLWDDAHVYFTTSDGRDWNAIELGTGPIQAVAVSPTSIEAIVGQANHSLWIIECADPTTGSRTGISPGDRVTSAAADIGDERNIWITTQEAISYWARIGESVERLAMVDGNYQRIFSHPRASASAYAIDRNSLARIDLAGLDAGQASEAPAAKPLNVDARRGELPPEESALAAADQDITQRVANSQPPLRSAIDAALRFANYDPDEVETWRRNARRSNALPELKLRAGNRDYPTDSYRTENAGTPLVDDIHQSDRIRGLDYAEVEVSWDLSDLLFDGNQPTISEEARERAADRNALIRDLTTLYYERIAVLVQLSRDADTLDADSRLTKSLDLMRMTDLLNELCGEPVFTSDIP